MKNTEFPITSGEQLLINTSVLMPNAGRLTKILYRFDHDAQAEAHLLLIAPNFVR